MTLDEEKMKEKVIAAIIEKLREELTAVTLSAKAAHEAATHSESKAEDQYDTRGLEASYLADAQAKRAGELQKLIALFQSLPIQEGRPSVTPGSLVELETNGKKLFYFLVQEGGGNSVTFEGRVIQVITPKSPLGDALFDRKAGEVIEVESQVHTREYRILQIL